MLENFTSKTKKYGSILQYFSQRSVIVSELTNISQKGRIESAHSSASPRKADARKLSERKRERQKKEGARELESCNKESKERKGSKEK